MPGDTHFFIFILFSSVCGLVSGLLGSKSVFLAQEVDWEQRKCFASTPANPVELRGLR